MSDKIRVLCWTDGYGLHTPERPIAYEEGIHNVLADVLNATDEFEATAAAVDEEPLQPASLDKFQCLLVWAHGGPIGLETQQGIVGQVESGKIGFIGLHSLLMFDCYPAIVGGLLGLTGRFGWEDGVPMRYTVTNPQHPVFEGVESFEVIDEAYYGPFCLVEGADLLLNMEVTDPAPRMSQLYNYELGTYERVEHQVAGLVSRAAWTYEIGKGKVLYFQPGHETDPTYREPAVQGILRRAASYVAST